MVAAVPKHNVSFIRYEAACEYTVASGFISPRITQKIVPSLDSANYVCQSDGEITLLYVYFLNDRFLCLLRLDNQAFYQHIFSVKI